MKSYLFVSFLLLLGAALQDPARAQSVAGGSVSESAAGTEARQPAMARPPAVARQPGAMTRPEHERENRGSAAYLGYPDAIIMPPPGYILTPSGQLIFPAAPPPMGDTSTLSGAGPDVSTGPVVGSGPSVSTGPEVGNDLDYPTAKAPGTAP
jgi:hypothetical protein